MEMHLIISVTEINNQIKLLENVVKIELKNKKPGYTKIINYSYNRIDTLKAVLKMGKQVTMI